MSDAVLVLGMHRSGTSAVAGVLTKLGGGAPKSLMPADTFNERGYFESLDFWRFHDELLASAGSTWDDWRAFNPGWLRSPAAEPFKRRALELFEAEFDASPLPVLKDPRISRFAPFWLGLLRESGRRPRVVIPVRSPLDAALSLRKRDGFSVTKGLLLWLRHVLDAEAHTRAEARSVFSWRDFSSGWRGVCDRIAADTRLSWPRLSDRAGLEIDRFLAESLIHHETDLDTLRANREVHEWALGAYEALIELGKNPQSNSALATLDQIRALLDDSSALFGRLLIDYEVDIERLKAEAGALASERDGLLARSGAAAAERDEARHALSARAAEFERAFSDAGRERAALSDAAHSARAERDASAAEARRLADDLVETRRRLDEQSARAAEFETRFIQAENEAGAQAVALAEAGRERDALAGERSRLNVRLDEVRRALEESSARSAELDRGLGEAVRALDELGRDREALAGERDRLAGELAARVAEAAVLAEALAASRSERDAVVAERERLASEVDALRADHAARTAAFEQALADARREAGAERERLASEVDALRADHAARTAAFEQALADARREAGAVRERLASEVDALRADHAARTAAFEQALADARREAGAVRERLASEVEALRADHAARTAAFEQALADARREAGAVRAALEAERRALADECARLAADLAAGEELTSDLAARQGELGRALGDAANQRDALAADLERLRREKAEARAEAEAERDRVTAQLGQAHKDREALALHRDRLASELQGQRRLATESAASAEAARRDHAAEAQALRTRLVDVEAALSHATRKDGGLLPGLWRTTMARKLVRSGLLDPEWYAATYPDVAQSGLRSAAHYLEIGFAKGYKPNPYFDTRFYLEQNEDVRRSGLNPLVHFLLHGWREGRDPSREFSTMAYLADNPDVQASGRNPLSHYLQDGRHEGRPPPPAC